MVDVINKAAFEGNLQELTDLLPSSTEIAKIVDPKDSNRGPLHFAVLGKRIEIVQFLLERFDASPFQLDEVQERLSTDGWSPLHVAASVGSAEIIELLIESVANGSSSSCPQDSVTLYCNQSTKDRSKQFPLHLAASKGHEQAVMRLICHGAKASVRNAFGQTPLHRAACAGKPQVVAVLMESDPSTVNWKDFSEDANTALHLAAEDGHFEVVRLLVELAHVDTTILNGQGKTAAQVAQSQEIRDYLASN